MPRSLTPAITRRGVALGAVLAASALTLAACSAPGASAPGSNAAPTSVVTDAAKLSGSLVLYDGAGLKTVDDALIAAFTKRYPKITVTGRYDPDNVQAQNAPRVLASADPPDIARINALSDIVRNGQLTNLDAYATAYGWGDLPAGQLAQYRVNDQFVRGSGSQYALASGFTVTGLYYNKSLLKRAGITTPPTTAAELDAALAKAKAAKITPLELGNQTGGLTFPVQWAINNAVGADSVNNWIFHKPNATIASSAAVDAVASVNAWVEAGYFNTDANGTDGTTALGRFARGDALFLPSGNWDAPAVDKGLGDDAGFILPPTGSSGKALAMSDPVSNFGIPAKSKNKDAAALFLNFLTSPEARAVMVQNGFAPSGSGDAPATSTAVGADVQKAFASLVAADGQVQFVQNATSGISATWTSQVQLLFAQKATGDAVLQAVQKQYKDELAG